MSEIRVKANKIREKGAAERRNWVPDADSNHYRVYKWWISKSGKKRPERENFCYYFWAVVLFAPALWLVVPLLWALLLTFVGLALWLIVQFTGAAIGLAAGAAILVYLYYSVKVGQQLLHDLGANDLSPPPVSWLDKRSLTLRALAVLSALPVLIVLALITLIAGTLFAIVAGLHKDYDAFGKSWRWFTGARIGNSKWASWIRPWLSVPVVLAVLAITSTTIRPAVLGLLASGIIVMCVLALVIFISFLTDYAKQRATRRTRRPYYSRWSLNDCSKSRQ